MLRVGLTGGVACGKTTVARMFEILGAQVLLADLIAQELMTPGQAVYHEVVKHFGREVVNRDGTINRSRLSKMVFGSRRIQELNKLVHPAVIAKQEEWMSQVAEREQRGVAIVEAALIFEAGVMRRFDKLMVVTAEEELKIERFARRVYPHGTREQIAQAREEAQQRIATQVPDRIKVQSADFVIDNSGTLEHTQEQANKVYQELQKIAASQR